ncbi:hypothetical protein BGW38_009996 [Lunasporangiospora selenospora]|uniref:Uncharacterized protein n=1 Tax=Lunasporangiospora selenospora TaxID=979761 RepID=A0A9P6FWX2_9FUNG|nr:hypothetical protein BGW38_009996 [Lunasporangiospora selenospora]
MRLDSHKHFIYDLTSTTAAFCISSPSFHDNNTPGTHWKADIDSNKPGANYFLTRTPVEYDPLSYFRHHGATSSLRCRLTQELSQWTEFFAASDKQVCRDIASFFRTYQKQTLSKFWDDVVKHEAQQQQQHERLLQQRRPSVEGAPDESEGLSQGPRTKKVSFIDAEFSSASGSDFADSNQSSVRSSLASIDLKYIDHLVGPGTTSSRLNTRNRLIVGEIDVSEVLLNARRDNLKKQGEIVDVSDLLTINFIFDMNLLRKHLSTATAESLLNVTVAKPTTSEIVLLMDFPIFAATHSSRDSLPTPHGFEELYFPDYFAEFDNLSLLVVEIKKPGAVDDDLDDDQLKLPCMMKLALDAILDAGVLEQSVVRLLIRGSRCEVSSISSDNEALFIYKSIGVFELPKNNLQLGLLCPAIGPLKFARYDVVLQTIISMAARRDDKCKKDK